MYRLQRWVLLQRHRQHESYAASVRQCDGVLSSGISRTAQHWDWELLNGRRYERDASVECAMYGSVSRLESG